MRHLTTLLLVVLLASSVDAGRRRYRRTKSRSTVNYSQPKTNLISVDVAEMPEGVLPIHENMLDRANSERARHGRQPLVLDMTLCRQCHGQSMTMARHLRMRHGSWNAAENIAAGQSTMTSVMRTWMNSPGHRNNILGNWTRFGVAAARGRNGQIYWTQQFQK